MYLHFAQPAKVRSFLHLPHRVGGILQRQFGSYLLFCQISRYFAGVDRPFGAGNAGQCRKEPHPLYVAAPFMASRNAAAWAVDVFVFAVVDVGTDGTCSEMIHDGVRVYMHANLTPTQFSRRAF